VLPATGQISQKMLLLAKSIGSTQYLLKEAKLQKFCRK
jgi:hypothetical protein